MKLLLLVSIFSFYGQAQVFLRKVECFESKAIMVDSLNIKDGLIRRLRAQALQKLDKQQKINQRKCEEYLRPHSFYVVAEKGTTLVKQTSYHLEKRVKEKSVLVKACHVSLCKGGW